MSSVSSCSYASLPSKQNPSKCLLRLQRTFKTHKAKPLPPVFKTRIDGPSPVWKVFKRLHLAESYADTATKDCMIFSYEGKVDNDGQRMFLVAHPKHMWSNYKYRPPKERCSYEVIRENHPCKLYFDLEYYTFFNNCKDGNYMTKIFIKCVIAALFEQHNVKIKKSDFLWLDASTEQKYSCHLILQNKETVFQNNIQAGIFVSSLLSTLEAKIANDASTNDLWPSAMEIKSLLIESKNNKSQMMFCDEGVYTKNRNFRLYLSTKAGKDSPLHLSPHNEYVPHLSGKCIDRDEAFFYDSLITYFSNQEITRFISYEGKNGPNIFHGTLMSASSRAPSKRPGVSGCTSSPFPELDTFVMGIIKDVFAVGFIRKWTYLSNEQRIIYDIGNYRYCSNVGRHHKSNNIKINVDMKAKFYYQTCLDPECRHQCFQSEAVAIPEDIVIFNIPDDFFDANCFTQQVDFNTEVESCHTVANGLLSTENVDNLDSFMDDEFDQDLASCFENFTQLNPVPDPNYVMEQNELISSHPKRMETQNSWDNFFDGDFSSSLTENPNRKKTCDLVDETATCLLNNEFWYGESDFDDSDSIKVQLGNISLEEELLMAEAAAAMEATIDESMFEETVF